MDRRPNIPYTDPAKDQSCVLGFKLSILSDHFSKFQYVFKFKLYHFLKTIKSSKNLLNHY